MKIYLDHSATTPVDKEVLNSMEPYFGEIFGNPSSIHTFGQKAREAIDQARADIAKILNCVPAEIIFTSGGSESDNLAIRGIVESARKKQNGFRPHIITSQIEHKAVLETIKRLEKQKIIKASFVNVNNDGLIDPWAVKKAIRRDTILVSIMYVNNETGVIQPIREIGKVIERANKKRTNRIYFHTDAVQAAQFMDLNVNYLHVDSMTLSAHKIYGPKGVGLLYLRRQTPIHPQITGGHQEDGLRAGTENVAFISGFSTALKKVKNEEGRNSKKLKKLRDYFEDKICRQIEQISINGSRKKRVPHISNVSFKGAEGESVILSLDLEGIAVSTGSACTSGSLEPSHVLIAMGIKPIIAQSSIRFSLGKHTTKKELDIVIRKLKTIIRRLRKISAIDERKI